MNTKELSAFIGKAGTWKDGGLSFEVTIKDARYSFGRVDLLIVPLTGTGQKWVQFDSVMIGGNGK